jgi:hypothetical protein
MMTVDIVTLKLNIIIVKGIFYHSLKTLIYSIVSMEQLCIIAKFGTGRNDLDGGLIFFLDFADMVNIKNSSKYMNLNVNLPVTAKLRISKRNIDSIFNTLKIYGFLIETINLSYCQSTLDCIKNCLAACPRLREISISCVFVTQIDAQPLNQTMIIKKLGSKEYPNKIITDQFLKSDSMQRLNKVIIYDSWIDPKLLYRQDAQELILGNVNIKSTESKCEKCGTIIFHKFDHSKDSFYYEKKHRCNRCIMYRRYKNDKWRLSPKCINMRDGIKSLCAVGKHKDEFRMNDTNKAYKKYMRRKLNV